METSSSVSQSYFDFLDRMRNPASRDLVRSIKSFIVSFSFSAASPENDGKRVQEFFDAMEGALRNHPLWEAATDQEIDSAMEALEKYVMTKLFTRTFGSSQEDRDSDLQISGIISSLQTFFEPRHLDIPPILLNQSSLLLAEKELKRMNAVKAPHEKLLCIVKCCRIINGILLKASESERQLFSGADALLALLIYITIKANPPQLHSNLRYIELYRRKAKLESEDAYYLTNLASSKAFIADLNAKSLSMDESEFKASMEMARQTDKLILNDPVVASAFVTPNTDEGGINYPYMETEAGDLTVKDVEFLLRMYKDVVVKYAGLSKAVKGLNLDLQSDTSSTILGQSELGDECK